MPQPDRPPLTRALALRSAGFAVAVALGAIAVWLIVIADSTKSMRLGVLAGIWGALLGAYSMFGARRHGLEADEPRPVPEVPALSAQEIALRSHHDVERVAEAAARRAFEDRLEQLLRRELSREVSDLRNEIARLRQDLLDKVGGQLRLERIETTRVIGSDLEALHHEVRQLKQASETGTLHELGLEVAPLRKVVEPAKVRPISRPSAEAEADIRPARAADEPVVDVPRDAGDEQGAEVERPGEARQPVEPVAAEPAVEPVVEPAPARVWTPPTSRPAAASNGTARNGASSNGTRPPTRRAGASRAGDPAAPEPTETTGPIRAQRPADRTRPAETWSPPAAPSAPVPAEAPEPAETSAHPAQTSADPFASLPRLTPFTEFELDPVDPAPHADPRPPAAGAGQSGSAYTGRRRRTDGDDADGAAVDVDDPDGGRHSRADRGAGPVDTGSRGRRRAAGDDDDDLLSRLLARGSADR